MPYDFELFALQAAQNGHLLTGVVPPNQAEPIAFTIEEACSCGWPEESISVREMPELKRHWADHVIAASLEK